MQVSPAESGFVSASTGLKAMGVNQNKTAKLFHMMSSTLYTDKHMSILRELCSNARDSHAEAGKLDTPFAIIAPSYDHQFLVVSDAGTGITYEKACTSILEFLSSTKDEGENAEEMIGGWGIGAKVPRAYTDNYQVYLRKGGVEWIVQVINDMAGLPQQMLMSEHKTHKPDGVDFVVPIQEVHINLWRDKVQRYMANTNYNVMAYMGAGEVIVPGKPWRSFEFDNFVLDVRGAPTRFSSYENLEIGVIYGGMVYQIPKEFESAALQNKICKMVHKGLQLFIRLDTPNAVRCGLSREQLEVDDRNKNLLLRAMMLIEEDLNRLKRPADDLVDEDTRNGYKREPVWSKIVELSNKLKAAESEAGQRSRLSAIFRGQAYTMRWNPDGLVKDYRGGTDRAEHTVQMPLSADDYPEVSIKYSEKRLTKGDIYYSGGGFKMECSVRTDDEAVARKWAEDNPQLAGVKLTFDYVESSWNNTRGGSSVKRDPYAVCELTGKRVELTASNPRVMIPSKEFMWLGCIGHIGVFMPKKSFRKSRVVEGSVVEFEDYIKSDAFKQAQQRFLYSAVDEAVEHTLQMAKDYSLVGMHWPSVLRNDMKVLRAKLDDLIHLIGVHKRLRSSIEDSWGPQNFLGVEQEPEITTLMREANQWIVRKEKEDNLYRVVDVDNLLKQFKEGNPEATRLMWAMKLEHFL